MMFVPGLGIAGQGFTPPLLAWAVPSDQNSIVADCENDTLGSTHRSGPSLFGRVRMSLSGGWYG